jgi:hypothetical protein
MEEEMADKVVDAILAAWKKLPLRDFEAPGGELDMLRKREAARAAINAYHDYIRQQS